MKDVERELKRGAIRKTPLPKSFRARGENQCAKMGLLFASWSPTP